ncbi:hypothetical protein C7N83_12535 [Neisseria iguanae]|uniref:Uncharacterized protein n=1 Tax=Neisseria iguanae TaxID=90242 RepID=A0A2P7TXC4_9NEIS|nr:hypothetical protein C7N83_12535 [Neisseria iguanae]
MLEKAGLLPFYYAERLFLLERLSLRCPGILKSCAALPYFRPSWQCAGIPKQVFRQNKKCQQRWNFQQLSRLKK